jgi:hypothetical protein
MTDNTSVFVKSTYDLEKSLVHCNALGVDVTILPHINTNAQAINKFQYEIVFQTEEDANAFKLTHPIFLKDLK